MEALIAELGELQVPELPEYEPDEVAFGDDRNTAFYEVLRRLRPRAAARRSDVAAPLRVPAARLRRLRDVRGLLQEPAPRHPRPAHRADGRRHRRAAVPPRRRAAPARAARARHRRRRRVRGRPFAGRGRRRARSRAKPAAPGWRSSSGSRTRGSTWPPATASTTTTAAGSTTRGSRTRRSAGISTRCARAASPSVRPRRSRASASGSPTSTARCSTRTRAQPFTELLALSRTVFPYVEEHKFYCDYWFLTRWWNKIREFGALLAEHRFLEDGEDLFHLTRHEVASALDELTLTWATGGVALGPEHWPPIVARRKQLLRAARPVDAAAGARRDAGGDHRPDDDHALGRDHRARAGVGAPDRRRRGAERRGGGPGRRRGDRAGGRARSRSSPTSRTARSSSAAAPRRRGRRSSRSSERPSPTSAA